MVYHFDDDDYDDECGDDDDGIPLGTNTGVLARRLPHRSHFEPQSGASLHIETTNMNCLAFEFVSTSFVFVPISFVFVSTSALRFSFNLSLQLFTFSQYNLLLINLRISICAVLDKNT